MRKSRQLTQRQRYQIEILLKTGHNQTQTAEQLGVRKSTISRELRRNRGKRGCRPRQAQRLANARRCASKARIPEQALLRVEQLLKRDWSPQQTSRRLALNEGISVSHQRIYQHVKADKLAGGSLCKHLRCQKKRRKRYGTPSQRGHIKNRVDIDQRPEIVDRRSRVGDWEADTVIGAKGGKVLVTLAERKSRYRVIAVAEDKKASSVSRTMVDSARLISESFMTVTCDNGKEFALHEELSRELGADWFFARPCRSWERGLSENTNGLVRQYFPKGMDFAGVKRQDVQRVMDKLNNRPRRCLGFKTPNQVFFGADPPVAFET